MQKRTSVAIVTAALTFAGVGYASVITNVSISGSTKECFMGSMVAVGGVNLAAFQVSAARPIVAQLDTMANFTGFATNTYGAASQKYDSLYNQLQSLIVNTRALSRAISAADGTFKMSFAPVDSVVLIGFADREDEQWYFSYQYLSGLASTSLVLDMLPGTCP
jgi:hypothetical protein